MDPLSAVSIEQPIPLSPVEQRIADLLVTNAQHKFPGGDTIEVNVRTLAKQIAKHFTLDS